MSLTSVDAYLGKVYDEDAYNCLHMARDVWYDLTGEDIWDRLGTLRAPKVHRTFVRRNRLGFDRLPGPVDPCIVLMRRPHTEPHLGVYLRGKVLHINSVGVAHQTLDVASLGYKTVSFYR